MRAHLTRPATAVGISLLAITLAMVVAAGASAPLTWDGAYYLFAMLNSGEPLVAQGRIADRYLHYPVVWLMQATDSQSIVQLGFSVIHVITPLVAILLSWLVVRKEHANLIIWPMLGIGMALLPGQINFISEGIKAEQLMWPLLLAILTGAQRWTLPLVVVLSVSIYFLHPVSAPILAAVGLAAVAIAFLNRDSRNRLLAIGASLLTAGIIRYREISSGYEQSEMTWETQQRQWTNGASGLPTLSIICCAVVALTLLVGPRLSGRIGQHSATIQLVAVIVSTISLAIWAAIPSLWWEALEFRGPAFWITMILAGAAFLSVALENLRPMDIPVFPGATLVAIALGFCLVLAIQSISWYRVVHNFRNDLNAYHGPCLPREVVRGYPHTPLNLWSTNALSLLNQGSTPSRVSMTIAECHEAKTTGRIAMSAGDFSKSARNFDVSGLHTSLLTGNVCSWHHANGWHQQEALIPDSWRWSHQDGELVITLESAATIQLEGEFQSIPRPNQVDVLVDGEVIASSVIDSDSRVGFDPMQIDLPAGISVVTLRSAAPPENLPGDERQLSISLWNPLITPLDGSSPCLQEDAP